VIKPLKLHICDDHELITSSLEIMLGDVDFINSITKSNCKEELLLCLAENNINILILDINVNGINMLEIIPQIKSGYPELKIILLTTYDSQYFKNAALQLNVNAYLFKNTQKEEVLHAINCVLNNKVYYSSGNFSAFQHKDNFELINELTKREIEILKYLAKGCSSQKIAEELSISIATVQTHRKNLKSKLNLKGTGEMITFLIENNLNG